MLQNSIEYSGVKPLSVDLDLSNPVVMTILNVTPDSFYEGSRAPSAEDIDRRIVAAVAGGCSIIDVGGYSSRPGAADVSADEEWCRVAFGIAAVRRAAPNMPVSVDTFRAQVARRAVEMFGAVIVNDISAGELDPDMIGVVAEYDLPYIAMHMRGTPASMQGLTDYGDIVSDVTDYFREKTVALERCGVKKIIIDPGFGFAKTTAQNFELLAGMHRLCELGYPVLAGVSRKSMIWKTLSATPADALAGTVALGWECLRQGASISRVHDTREAADTIKIYNEFRQNNGS